MTAFVYIYLEVVLAVRIGGICAQWLYVRGERRASGPPPGLTSADEKYVTPKLEQGQP